MTSPLSAQSIFYHFKLLLLVLGHLSVVNPSSPKQRVRDVEGILLATATLFWPFSTLAIELWPFFTKLQKDRFLLDKCLFFMDRQHNSTIFSHIPHTQNTICSLFLEGRMQKKRFFQNHGWLCAIVLLETQTACPNKHTCVVYGAADLSAAPYTVHTRHVWWAWAKKTHT